MDGIMVLIAFMVLCFLAGYFLAKALYNHTDGPQ